MPEYKIAPVQDVRLAHIVDGAIVDIGPLSLVTTLPEFKFDASHIGDLQWGSLTYEQMDALRRIFGLEKWWMRKPLSRKVLHAIARREQRRQRRASRA